MCSIVREKVYILNILYAFGAVQGLVIHYLIEIQHSEIDHNSLEHNQTGPRQLCWDWLCVNTSFLIHIADYKLLNGILKKPQMYEEQTTVQFLWEKGGRDNEWFQAVLLQQSTETTSTSLYISESHKDVVCLFLASLRERLADFDTEDPSLLYTIPSHCLTATPTKHGTISLSPLMGTKGQSLIIHSGCQTMLAGCYLGWGRPTE